MSLSPTTPSVAQKVSGLAGAGIAATTPKAASLQRNMKFMEMQNTTLQRELRECMSENMQLRQRIEALGACEAQLKRIVEIETEHVGHTDSHIVEMGKLEAELTDSQAEVGSLKAQLERLQRSIAAVTEQRAATNMKLSAQMKRVRAIEEAAEEAAEEAEIMREEIQELHKTVESLELENEELELQVSAGRKRRTRSLEEPGSPEKELEEAMEAHSTIYELRRELEEARRRDAARDQAVSAAVAAFDMAKSSRDAAEARVRQLEGRAGMAHDDQVGELVETLEKELLSLRGELLAMKLDT